MLPSTPPRIISGTALMLFEASGARVLTNLDIFSQFLYILAAGNGRSGEQ